MIKKGVNIILTVLILAVSTGLNLNKHFCQNKLVSLSIYKAAKDCGMETFGSSNQEMCGRKSISKGNCCRDESEFLKLKDEFVPKQYTGMNTVNFVLFNYPLVRKNGIQVSFDLRYLNYIPPPIERDFSVLFQSFLC